MSFVSAEIYILEEETKEKKNGKRIGFLLSVSPIGFGVFRSLSELLGRHLGLLVQEAPLEYATIERGAVNVRVLEIVPVEAVDYWRS